VIQARDKHQQFKSLEYATMHRGGKESGTGRADHNVSLNGEGHCTVTKAVILRIVSVEGHGDDPLSFYDTPPPLSS
jgi:hypothetical protein